MLAGLEVLITCGAKGRLRKMEAVYKLGTETR